MSGNRTEAPTPRRLREARRRGQSAVSRELRGAVALLAGLGAMVAAGPGVAASLAALLRASLTSAPEAASLPAFGDTLARLAPIGAPLLLAPALAAGAAGLLQAGGVASLAPLQPRLDRIDPLAGLRRLASPEPLLRAGLGLAKGGAAVAILWSWLGEHGRALARLPLLGAGALGVGGALAGLAWRLALLALACGLVDLALARRRHRRSLMMTREEVRRESKEDEGDPQHRSERRRLHQALLEAGPVSRATVVVVNPTRIAIALRHVRGGDDAPRVLAKGTGDGAARIRSAARRAGVPIVRDVLLARALFRLAEVGEEIPAELYDAAAGVLAHLYGVAEEPA